MKGCGLLASLSVPICMCMCNIHACRQIPAMCATGLPSQARPWWADDGSPSMRRLPSTATSQVAGSLEISRSERSAAERAGMRALCFQL